MTPGIGKRIFLQRKLQNYRNNSNNSKNTARVLSHPCCYFFLFVVLLFSGLILTWLSFMPVFLVTMSIIWASSESVSSLLLTTTSTVSSSILTQSLPRRQSPFLFSAVSQEGCRHTPVFLLHLHYYCLSFPSAYPSGWLWPVPFPAWPAQNMCRRWC